MLLAGFGEQIIVSRPLSAWNGHPALAPDRGQPRSCPPSVASSANVAAPRHSRRRINSLKWANCRAAISSLCKYQTLVAEKERLLISQRTKAALATKKAQGAKLGNPRAAETVGKAHAANRAAADRHAANVLPIVREIQKSGLTTLREIVAALNARGVRTARGGNWHSTTVRNLLMRAK